MDTLYQRRATSRMDTPALLADWDGSRHGILEQKNFLRGSFFVLVFLHLYLCVDTTDEVDDYRDGNQE